MRSEREESFILIARRGLGRVECRKVEIEDSSLKRNVFHAIFCQALLLKAKLVQTLSHCCQLSIKEAELLMKFQPRKEEKQFPRRR